MVPPAVQPSPLAQQAGHACAGLSVSAAQLAFDLASCSVPRPLWCSKPGTYAPDSKSPECKLCLKGYQCPTSAMK